VELGALMADALAYLPALWVMLGLCALLVGALPRLTGLAWAVYTYSFVMMYFGRLFDLPEWAHRLSPFGNIPQVPVQELSAAPLAVLTVLAMELTAAGIAGFRQRDIG
jgi:ABC-2 type transport system permease protein